MPLRTLLQRRGAPERAAVGSTTVVIVTGSCCIPGMRPFDAEARRVVEQAIAEEGVPASVRELPASSAMFGGAPKTLMAELIRMANEGGRIGLPAVLLNGEVLSYGVPAIEQVRAALRRAASADEPADQIPATESRRAQEEKPHA